MKLLWRLYILCFLSHFSTDQPAVNVEDPRGNAKQCVNASAQSTHLEACGFGANLSKKKTDHTLISTLRWVDQSWSYTDETLFLY